MSRIPLSPINQSVTRLEDEYMANPDMQILELPEADTLPQLDDTILQKTGRMVGGGLGAAANVLDLPLSTVRDVATWVPGGMPAQNPLDQWIDPLGSRANENRIETRDIYRANNLAMERDTWANAIGAFATDVVADPLNLLSFGATSAGKAIARTGLKDEVRRAANYKAAQMANDPKMSSDPEMAKMDGAGHKLTRTIRGVGARAKMTPQDIFDSILDPEAKAAAMREFQSAGGTPEMVNQPLSALKIKVPLSGYMNQLYKQATGKDLPKGFVEGIEITTNPSAAMKRWVEKNKRKVGPDTPPPGSPGAAANAGPGPAGPGPGAAPSPGAPDIDPVDIDPVNPVDPTDPTGTPGAGDAVDVTNNTLGDEDVPTAQGVADPLTGLVDLSDAADTDHKNIGRGSAVDDALTYHGSSGMKIDDSPYDIVDASVGSQFNSHGLSKGSPAEQARQLDNLLSKGVDESRDFYTAPFEVDSNNRAAMAAAMGTSGGTAYKSGVAVVTGGYGTSIKDGGIVNVFINDAMPQLKAAVEAKYGDRYNVHFLSEQKEVLESQAKSTAKPRNFAPTVVDGAVDYADTRERFSALSESHRAYQESVLDPLVNSKTLSNGDAAFLQTILSQSDMRFIPEGLSADPMSIGGLKSFGMKFPRDVMNDTTGAYNVAQNKILIRKAVDKYHGKAEVLLHETGHAIFTKMQQADPEFYNAAFDAIHQQLLDPKSGVSEHFKKMGADANYFTSNPHEAFSQLFANLSSGKIKPEALPPTVLEAIKRAWEAVIEYSKKAIGALPPGDAQFDTIRKMVDYAGGYIPKAERDSILAQLDAASGKVGKAGSVTESQATDLIGRIAANEDISRPIWDLSDQEIAGYLVDAGLEDTAKNIDNFKKYAKKWNPTAGESIDPGQTMLMKSGNKVLVDDLRKLGHRGHYDPYDGVIRLDRSLMKDKRARDLVVRHELAHLADFDLQKGSDLGVSDVYDKVSTEFWNIKESQPDHPIVRFAEETIGSGEISEELIANLYADGYQHGKFVVPLESGPSIAVDIPKPIMEALDTIEDRLGIWGKKRSRGTAGEIKTTGNLLSADGEINVYARDGKWVAEAESDGIQELFDSKADAVDYVKREFGTELYDEFDQGSQTYLMRTSDGATQDPFYYKAEQALPKLGGRFGFDQFSATMKKAGVKDEELADLGMADLFRPTQEEIDNVFTRHGYDGSATDDIGITPDNLDEYISKGGEDPDVLKDLKELQKSTVRTPAQVKKWIDDNRVEIREVTTNQFSGYQIPGGDEGTYRELLISKPSYADESENFRRSMHSKYGDGWVGKATPEERAEYSRLIDKRDAANETGGDYTAGHFDTPNVIAHVRMDDVTLPNGKKALRIQEVQSDWHQTGRKEGYVPTEAQRAEYKKVGKRLNDLEEFLEEWYREREELYESAIDSGDYSKYDDFIVTHRENIQQINEEANRLRTTRDQYRASTGDIPRGPFSKSWSSLAMKHVLKEAVEKGYDEIWISNGVDSARSVGGPEKELGTFYNDILTGDFKKYTKKWNSHQGIGNNPKADGLATTWRSPDENFHLLESAGPLPFSASVEKVKGGDWKVTFHIDEVGDDVVGRYKSLDEAKAEAKKYLDDEIKRHGIEQHNFTGDVNVFSVTPKMREDILGQGQTYYMKMSKQGEKKLNDSITNYPGLKKEKIDEFTDLAKQAHKMIDESYQRHNDAVRTLHRLLDSNPNKSTAAARVNKHFAEGGDLDAIPGGDELVEYARNNFPDLVGGVDNAEAGVTSLLREGIKKIPEPWHDVVLKQAEGMAGPGFFDDALPPDATDFPFGANDPSTGGIRFDSRGNADAEAGEQLGLFGDVSNVARGVVPLDRVGETRGSQQFFFDTGGDPNQMGLFDDGITPTDLVNRDAQPAADAAPTPVAKSPAESVGPPIAGVSNDIPVQAADTTPPVLNEGVDFPGSGSSPTRENNPLLENQGVPVGKPLTKPQQAIIDKANSEGGWVAVGGPAKVAMIRRLEEAGHGKVVSSFVDERGIRRRGNASGSYVFMTNDLIQRLDAQKAAASSVPVSPADLANDIPIGTTSPNPLMDSIEPPIAGAAQIPEADIIRTNPDTIRPQNPSVSENPAMVPDISGQATPSVTVADNQLHIPAGGIVAPSITKVSVPKGGDVNAAAAQLVRDVAKIYGLHPGLVEDAKKIKSYADKMVSVAPDGAGGNIISVNDKKFFNAYGVMTDDELRLLQEQFAQKQLTFEGNQAKKAERAGKKFVDPASVQEAGRKLDESDRLAKAADARTKAEAKVAAIAAQNLSSAAILAKINRNTPAIEEELLRNLAEEVALNENVDAGLQAASGAPPSSDLPDPAAVTSQAATPINPVVNTPVQPFEPIAPPVQPQAVEPQAIQPQAIQPQVEQVETPATQAAAAEGVSPMQQEVPLPLDPAINPVLQNTNTIVIDVPDNRRASIISTDQGPYETGGYSVRAGSPGGVSYNVNPPGQPPAPPDPPMPPPRDPVQMPFEMPPPEELPETVAQRIYDYATDGIDRFADMLYKIPYFPDLRAMFKSELLGGLEEHDRAAGRLATDLITKSEEEARRWAEPFIVAIHRTGKFDEQALIAQGKTPEEAVKYINDMNNKVMNWIEFGGDIPKELEDLAPAMRFIEGSYYHMRKLENISGVMTRKLEDDYADYLARQKRNPSKRGVVSFDKNRGLVLDTSSKSGLARKAVFKNRPGGTAVINEISTDANVSGILHTDPVLRKELSVADMTEKKSALGDRSLREYMFEEYGDRLLSDEALAKAVKDGVNDSDALDDMIQTAAKFDPGYAAENLPIFGRDFLSDFMVRLQESIRVQSIAKASQDMIGKALVNSKYSGLPDDQVWSMGKLMSEMKMGSRQWGPQAMVNMLASADPTIRQHADMMVEFARKDAWQRLHDGETITKSVMVSSDNAAFSSKKGLDHHMSPRRASNDEFLQIGDKATFEPIMTKPKGLDKDGKPKKPQFTGQVKVTRIIGGAFDEAEKTNLVKGTDPTTGEAAEVLTTKKVKEPKTETKIIEVDGRVLDDFVRGEALDKFLRPDFDVVGGKKVIKPPYPGANFPEYVIPKEVGEAAVRFQRPFNEEQAVGAIRGALMTATNLFKVGATSIWPAFHARNFLSGQYNNFAHDAYDPRTLNPIKRYYQPIADAKNLRHGKEIDGIQQIYKDKDFTPQQAQNELASEIFSVGLLSSDVGIGAELLSDSHAKMISQIPGQIKPGFSPAPIGATTLDQWNPVAVTGGFTAGVQDGKFAGKAVDEDYFAPVRYGKDFATTVEYYNRVAPYIAYRRQGYSPSAARDMVNRNQADYSKLTPFEKRNMRLMIPFYSFTRRIAPTVIEDVIKHPGGKTAQAIKLSNRMRDPDENVPDHISSTAAIPFGTRPDGSKSFFTGFGLPHEDALNLIDAPMRMAFGGRPFMQEAQAGVREIVSRSNPIAKSIFEIGSGQSSFFDGPGGGRALTDLDPPIGRTVQNIQDMITGEQTAVADPIFGSPALEYVASNSPYIGRAATSARQLTDKRKWSSPSAAVGLALNLLTGIRVNDVSPAAMDGLIRDRIGELLKERGSRRFSRDYVPADKLEGLDEAERQEIELLLESLRVIDKRFKIRREQKEAAEAAQ